MFLLLLLLCGLWLGFFVERIFGRFFVVVSNFDARVVAIFVVVCAAVVCFIVDCIDVATGVSVIELVRDGTAGAVNCCFCCCC